MRDSPSSGGAPPQYRNVEAEVRIDRDAARHAEGDLEGELQNYDEVIRLGYNPFHKG
jgi:hypothetical protein